MNNFVNKIIDALLVSTVDNNGVPSLGIKLSTIDGSSVWLNGATKFTDGRAELEGHGMRAVVVDVRKEDKKWDFEMRIGDAEFRGWKNPNAPHTAGFKPVSTAPGTEYRPLEL